MNAGFALTLYDLRAEAIHRLTAVGARGADSPREVRRRRTEVFQQSLGPALEMARQLGVSLPGTSLAEN